MTESDPGDVTAELEVHRVAVVVFVEAVGVDESDAVSVAEFVVRRTLVRAALAPGRGATLVAVDRAGRERSATLHEVLDVGTAAANGYLRTSPTFKAYPRSDDD